MGVLAGKRSEKSRRKMSESRKRMMADPAYVNPRLGLKHSEESKAKMSATRRAKNIERRSIEGK